MSTVSRHSKAVTLVRANAEGSKLLCQQVGRREKLRVRHGIYVETATWQQAPPWARYRMALAAEAMHNPSAIFCRESALLLYGLPLLHVPPVVVARTSAYGRAGLRRAPQLPGGQNIPAKYVEPALPPNVTRHQLRQQLRAGEHRIPRMELPAAVLEEIVGPDHFWVDPLELALVDTVSRMPFAAAVVVLDAALREKTLDVEPWLPYLRSRRGRAHWSSAWDFADPRAESAGESWSRVIIHVRGFPAPQLQSVLCTDEGEFRVDFCWEKPRVIGEFDGRTKYFDDEMLNGRDPREVLYQEKRREDALRRSGWTVVRWGWQELRQPQALLQRLRRAGVQPLTE
ncbi:hypothetical protein [Nesterenkonia alba]|uniref:hypothetical protein n=1 Tax=Nesterenkonia alba TaxID=515814 RepID=UPI0003B5A300|nr:hypothetical protein [Nesterenkonia alba]